MSITVDITKIKYGVAICLYSGLGAFYGQPYIHGNSEATNIIVTVFSILAGFLVAVITIIGDPSALPSGSWRLARLSSDQVYIRLTRHKLLFLVYLLTLLLIFLNSLIKGEFPAFELWTERIYLFLAIAAFTLSFQLPSALMDLHTERIEHEITARRKLEGITDDEE